jgi:hypothetical protein
VRGARRHGEAGREEGGGPEPEAVRADDQLADRSPGPLPRAASDTWPGPCAGEWPVKGSTSCTRVAVRLAYPNGARLRAAPLYGALSAPAITITVASPARARLSAVNGPRWLIPTLPLIAFASAWCPGAYWTTDSASCWSE